jgi:hypothetical protein
VVFYRFEQRRGLLNSLDCLQVVDIKLFIFVLNEVIDGQRRAMV